VLREHLGTWLLEQHVAAQLAFEVKLVAHEAAKNAIDHSDPCDHVNVYAEVDRDEIVVRVGDTNAHPWEPRAVTATSELHGLELIRALTRKMSVVRNDDGTTIIMLLGRN
jgi:anti-sigma regulatory factor (Ser/Thr protein kinase)